MLRKHRSCSLLDQLQNGRRTWLVGRLELSPTALVNGVTFRELRDGLCFEDLYQSWGNFTLRTELGQNTRRPTFDDEATTPVRWNNPLESAPFVTT